MTDSVSPVGPPEQGPDSEKDLELRHWIERVWAQLEHPFVKNSPVWKAIDAFANRAAESLLRERARTRLPEPSEAAVNAARAEFYEHANEYPGDVEMTSILRAAYAVDRASSPVSSPAPPEE